MRITIFILFLLPVLLLSSILYYGIFWNVRIALTNYSILNPLPRFTGFQGFFELLSDPEFVQALVRTMLWAALLVFLGNIVGLLLASSIFQLESARLRNALTAFFIYPLSLSMVVVGIIWRWLFDQYKGVNMILTNAGLPSPQWLEGSNAFWSLVFVSVWVYGGFTAMLYLAMFYNVSRSLIESAMIDGAGALTIMRRIVLPNSRQGLIISTIFLTLFAIQMFDLPYSMLFLNPLTQTLVMYIYIKFVSLYFYMASAAAVVIIAISAFIVIPYAIYGIKRWIASG
ncbi:MAG TPA: sugar ABC transporter permease [Sulfolobales archaeon]|nr:sugar ABC transporter permease [Sulfolobales archaeon]